MSMEEDERIEETGSAEPPPAEPKGLECPACGCRHFSVYYTEPRCGLIRRRRECRHCGKRITTVEQIL